MTRSAARGLLRYLALIAAGLVLILLMLYMSGVLKPNRIDPDRTSSPSPQPSTPGKTVQAQVRTITEYFDAVGTVRSRSETAVGSQVIGRILRIPVQAGDRVDEGDLLVVLDDQAARARLDQARQGLNSAKARLDQARQAQASARAAHNQAKSQYLRVQELFTAEAATEQGFEQAQAAYLQARAGLRSAEKGLNEAEAMVQQAEKVVEESRISLGYHRILASQKGQVVRKLVEVGDLAIPGKPLLTLQAPGELRLEALVREGLIHRITPDSALQVDIDALEVTLEGTVVEIVPSADPATRTFLVKVSLPPHKGVYTGMFGRLLVPEERRQVVAVPEAAVSRTGQLQTVLLREDERWQKIHVKTGRTFEDGSTEILSGLNGGESLLIKGIPHE